MRPRFNSFSRSHRLALLGAAAALLFAASGASALTVEIVEPIPEPGTAILMAAGLIGLARMGRPRA